MKKKLIIAILLITTTLFSCSNTNEYVAAFEEATTAMSEVTSNDELDYVNWQLIEKICYLYQADKSSSYKDNLEAIETAFNTYWDTMKSKATDNHGLWVPYPSIENAARYTSGWKDIDATKAISKIVSIYEDATKSLQHVEGNSEAERINDKTAKDLMWAVSANDEVLCQILISAEIRRAEADYNNVIETRHLGVGAFRRPAIEEYVLEVGKEQFSNE